MPKKINSAYRIHKIISSTTNQPPNSPTLGVWATAFDIKESSGTKVGLKVAKRLDSLLNELSLMKCQLLKSDFDEETYTTDIQHIELALDPVYFNSTWNSVTQYLTPVTIKSLLIFSQSLPNEETEITSDEINELFARLSELENFLENSTLPDRLIQLIRNHIYLIREALYEYPIAGAKALIEARRAAYGEIVELKGELKENKSVPEIKKHFRILKHFSNIADGAIRVQGVVEIGKKAVPWLESFLS